MAVVAAAADVCAVASHAGGNAVFAGALKHRVIHTVHGHDAGAAAAVEDEGRVRVLHAAEIGFCDQSAGHILPQVDAQTGQAVGIGAGEVGVGDDGGQRGGVALGDALRHDQALDQSDLLIIRKVHHSKNTSSIIVPDIQRAQPPAAATRPSGSTPNTIIPPSTRMAMMQ